MKTDIFMPFYVGDYLKDTMHLTARDHGCYLLLILAYWNNGGPLPDDDEYLAGVTKCSLEEWSSVRRRLQRFFIVSEFSLSSGTGMAQAEPGQSTGMAQAEPGQSTGMAQAEPGQSTGRAQAKPVWRHKRIDFELARAARQRKLASEKGKAGAAKVHSQRLATTAKAQAEPGHGTGRAQAEHKQPSGDASATPEPEHRSSTSPSPSPSYKDQEHPPTGAGERPSLAEVKTYAYTIGLGQWKAVDWWQEMQGCGWRDYSNREIHDWKAVIARVKVKWEADGRPDGPPSSARPTVNVATATGISTADSIRLQNELERVEKRLKRIVELSPSTMADGPIFSEEHKAERSKLLERKREILKALGFKA